MKNPELKEYFMYGVSIPYERYTNLLDNPNQEFEDYDKDEDDDEENTYTFFYSRDGKYVIIGRVLEIFNDELPYELPELMEIDKIMIMRSIYERFGIDDEFHYFFVKRSK